MSNKLTPNDIKKHKKTNIQIIHQEIDKRLANYVHVIPGKVVAVKGGGLRLDVQLLIDETILENVENYNTRRVVVGTPSHGF
jgi:hypothetical protein